MKWIDSIAAASPHFLVDGVSGIPDLFSHVFLLTGSHTLTPEGISRSSLFDIVHRLVTSLKSPGIKGFRALFKSPVNI